MKLSDFKQNQINIFNMLNQCPGVITDMRARQLIQSGLEQCTLLPDDVSELESDTLDPINTNINSIYAKVARTIYMCNSEDIMSVMLNAKDIVFHFKELGYKILQDRYIVVHGIRDDASIIFDSEDQELLISDGFSSHGVQLKDCVYQQEEIKLIHELTDLYNQELGVC